jgi:hypothetical protein
MQGAPKATEVLQLLRRLGQPPADPADVTAAIQKGLACHERMLALEKVNQRGAIEAALLGARLLSAVQSLDTPQANWVLVHEEQCCSCGGRWIHALAQTDEAVTAEWLRNGVELLERLQTINTDARTWVPTLQADLRGRLNRSRKPSTAALINYFNDEDMLRWQLDGGFLDQYDRVYIWDGPYRYLDNLPLFRFGSERLDRTELGRRLLADPRVNYHHASWHDERDKRIHAYQAIEEDVIVLHDTDEFPCLDHKRLQEFWQGSGGVASLQLENLYSGGLSGASEHYVGDSPDSLPRKWVIFKRSEISAENHINYLWLVGVEQQPMDHALLHYTPICHAYHLTGCRNSKGQTNKIAFYIALALRDGRTDAAMEQLSGLVNAGELTLEQAQRIFLAGNAGYAGLPHPDTGIRLKRRLANADFPDALLKRILAEGQATACGTHQILDHHPLFVWLPGNSGLASLTLELEGLSQVAITFWRWMSGQPADRIDEHRARCRRLVLGQWLHCDDKPDCMGHLLMIKAAGLENERSWQWLKLG